VIDATSHRDNRPVLLKKLSRLHRPQEVNIMAMFARMKGSERSRNHCVPVLQALHDPQDPDITLVAMPLLRPYDNPPLETVGEVVELLRQIFEGLYFMHRNQVAHRNLRLENILMDPSKLCPAGSHPILLDRSPDLSSPAMFHSRRDVQPMYYITDFRDSHRWSPQKSQESRVDYNQDAFVCDIRDLGVSMRDVLLKVRHTSF
jgi:serine/threonine protein kinase